MSLRTPSVRPAFPALALSLVMFLAACGGGHPAADWSAAEATPVAVRTLHPSPAGAAPDLILPARVKAVEEVTVSSRLAARLTGLPFREGQPFQKGDALALFESPETRQNVASAEAALEAATVTLEKARRQEARMDSLRGTGVASERQQELAVLDRRSAEASRAQAQAALAELKQNTAISVPFDGVVVRRYVDPGSPVSPGQPLLDVRSSAATEVEVPVPESELGRLREGSQVWFRVGTGPWLPAEVARIAGMTDFATRTRTVHVRPTGATGPLEPGAYAEVRLRGAGGSAAPEATVQEAAVNEDGSPALGGHPRLSLPASTLVRRGSLAGVFVVEEGKAWLRWLRIGREDQGFVEVLAGLDPGESVVMDPAELTDGRPVTATPVDSGHGAGAAPGDSR